MTGHPDLTHADSIQADLNRVKALELKLAGASYRDIAKALDVSVSTAHGYIASEMEEVRELNRAMAVELKQLSLARINKMRLSLWSKRENPRVADTLIRLEEREARLMGYDAPVRWEGSGPDGGPIPVSGGIDLSKLSLEQLRQLESIVAVASAEAEAAAPSVTIAGELQPVQILPAVLESVVPPVTPPSTNGNGDHP